LQGVVSKWAEKARHLRQLHQWSRDAEFYFLTSKTLKRWKASTEETKREKRKAAYAQVRRTTKMNLARGILLGWSSKARKILHMETQAQDISQNKNVIIGMNIFDRWRARTEEIAEMESIWRERVLRKHFVVWQARSTAFQDLTVEAIVNFQERRQSRAIKKWNLVMLQLRAQSIYAAEIREKNAKRTFRKMFSYWHQKAAERRPIERVEAQGPIQMGATARTEAWSDFGDEAEGDEWAKGLDEAITSTPAPGYLSTPSRRTERVAAAAARFSSTTPRALLSTPFERQLRAQYSGGLLPSLRKGPGRSTLGIGGGFPDINDRSTNDDRGKT
jgi:protein SFI1